MAATYSPSLATTKDKIRFRIGDTNPAAADIQDETITALLAETGATPLSVSVRLVQGLVASYSKKVDFDVDGQGQRWSAAVKSYRNLLSDLEDELAVERATTATDENIAAAQAMGGGIMVGGLSVSENIRRSEDTDRAANYGARYDR